MSTDLALQNSLITQGRWSEVKLYGLCVEVHPSRTQHALLVVYAIQQQQPVSSMQCKRGQPLSRNHALPSMSASARGEPAAG